MENPVHKRPADIAGDTTGESASPSDRDTKDGTKGFSPQLAGNGISGVTGSSSFDVGPDFIRPDFPTSMKAASPELRQEEDDRKRRPANSVQPQGVGPTYKYNW